MFRVLHTEAGGALPAERLPRRQHVSSDLDTAFRDWYWGEKEIQETLDKIEPLLDGVGEASTTLVLGGGCGRFSYELARRGDGGAVVQLDLNPLLTRNERGELRSRADVARTRFLSPLAAWDGAPRRGDLRLFGDASRMRPDHRRSRVLLGVDD
ncbi:MAG: hypothetical protein GY910_09940 [bacterium]|nr:hypothetical protein [bacterium]